MSTLGISGKSGFARMRPDDAELGARVRQATWDAAGRTLAVGAARERHVVAMVRAKHPRALDVVPEEAIAALLHEPPPGRCNWDRFRAAMAEAGKQLPSPPPAGLAAALGSMCARCKVAFDQLKVAEREAGHIAAVVAAGLKPSAAGRYRSAALARRVAAEIETLRQAPLKRRR
jgi:hypothetical protein